MKQLLGCSLFGLGLLLASFCFLLWSRSLAWSAGLTLAGFLLAYLGYKLTEEE
jgi:hypothetical protein